MTFFQFIFFIFTLIRFTYSYRVILRYIVCSRVNYVLFDRHIGNRLLHILMNTVGADFAILIVIMIACLPIVWVHR